MTDKFVLKDTYCDEPITLTLTRNDIQTAANRVRWYAKHSHEQGYIAAGNYYEGVAKRLQEKLDEHAKELRGITSAEPPARNS